jgi:hypothetical protein
MDPDPAAEFANTWTMKLLDSTGKPVAGAKLSFPGPPNRPAVAFTPWMPKMGHPASLQVSPQDNGDGTYTLTNLDFTMAGIWQLIVQATWGSVTERATFTFCVP